MMIPNYKCLGEFIEEQNVRNKTLDIELGEESLLGIKIDKSFIPSKANTNGTSFKEYKIIYHNQFAYNPATSRNGEKISIALLKEDKGMVSSAYKVFSVIDEDILNPEYLMLWFERDEFDRYARFKSHGAVREMFTWEELCKTKVPIPSIDIQNKIVDLNNFLNQNIENKIELNNKILNNLSHLYKEWFNNFRNKENNTNYSKDNLPEDWHMGKLGEIIKIYDSDRIPLSKDVRLNMDKTYPYYGAATLMDYVEDYLFDGVYLLLGEDGTVVTDKGYPILQYVWGKFWVNNHAHVLQEKNGFSVESLYLLLKNTDVRPFITGAVQKKINQTNLKSIDVLVPPKYVLEEFNQIIHPFFRCIQINKDECTILMELRKILIPNLMVDPDKLDKIKLNF